MYVNFAFGRTHACRAGSCACICGWGPAPSGGRPPGSVRQLRRTESGSSCRSAWTEPPQHPTHTRTHTHENNHAYAKGIFRRGCLLCRISNELWNYERKCVWVHEFSTHPTASSAVYLGILAEQNSAVLRFFFCSLSSPLGDLQQAKHNLVIKCLRL